MLLRLTILYSVAAVAAYLFRKQSASLRHSIWCCAMAGALLLPAAEWRLPKHVIERQLPIVIQVVADSAGGTERFHSENYSGVIWMVGTGIMLAGVAIRRIRLAKVVASAKRVVQLGPVSVRMTAKIQTPGVCGILSPSILVPEDSGAWTASVRRSVFCHEFAHIRRRDPLTLLAAELARAVYWFHPLTWFAFAEMRKESERACDDAVIRGGLRPSSYAGHLLHLARTFSLRPAIPMATTSHLESRMKAILDPRMNRNAAARGEWFAAALATAAMLVPLCTFSLQARQQTDDQALRNRQAKLDAERAEMQSQSQQRIRVGGNVAQSNLVVKVTPIYPAGAKERRAQGLVVLDVIISREGVPESIEPKTTDVDSELVSAAIEAVRQWRYRPTLLNGEPVEVATTVDVNFTLQP